MCLCLRLPLLRTAFVLLPPMAFTPSTHCRHSRLQQPCYRRSVASNRPSRRPPLPHPSCSHLTRARGRLGIPCVQHGNQIEYALPAIHAAHASCFDCQHDVTLVIIMTLLSACSSSPTPCSSRRSLASSLRVTVMLAVTTPRLQRTMLLRNGCGCVAAPADGIGGGGGS